jgi:hypothetical protein
MRTGEFDEAADRAKAKLDELKKTIHDTVKIDVDNSALRQIAHTEAIHRMMGSRQAVRIRADLDDGEARARLAVLTRSRTTTIHVRTDTSQLGILNRLIGGLGSKIPGSVGPVPLAGIAAALPAAAALLVEITGIASGLAAAGAGAVAFGLLARPAFRSVQEESRKLSEAQDKLAHARDVFAVAPTEKHAKALKEAADQLKAYERHLSEMPKTQQAAIKGMSGLSAEFGKMSKAFEPKAFSVFASGLKLLKDLLPSITPFANTFATAMSKWLANLDKASKSKGFQDFLKQFHSLEGPALQAITAGIGKVAGSIGRLMTTLSGKDVAHALNIAFGAAAGIIDRLAYGIRNIANMWDALSGAAGKAGHAVAQAGKDIASGAVGWYNRIVSAYGKVISFFAGLPGKIKSAVGNVAGLLADKGSQIINGLLKGAQSFWGNVTAWFSGIKGRVTGFFSGAIGWLLSAGEAILQGLLNGLESMAGTVLGWVKSFASSIGSVFSGILHIFSPSRVFYGYGQMIGQGLIGGMLSQVSGVQAASSMLAAAAAGGGWVGSAGPGLVGSAGGSAGFGEGHAALAGGGGPIVIENHLHIDGRELHSAMSRTAVQAQRRTGNNGMAKRTR